MSRQITFMCYRSDLIANNAFSCKTYKTNSIMIDLGGRNADKK